eukprot:scpid84317/ scgid18893/ 
MLVSNSRQQQPRQQLQQQRPSTFSSHQQEQQEFSSTNGDNYTLMHPSHSTFTENVGLAQAGARSNNMLSTPSSTSIRTEAEGASNPLNASTSFVSVHSMTSTQSFFADDDNTEQNVGSAVHYERAPIQSTRNFQTEEPEPISPSDSIDFGEADFVDVEAEIAKAVASSRLASESMRASQRTVSKNRTTKTANVTELGDKEYEPLTPYQMAAAASSATNTSTRRSKALRNKSIDGLI